MGDVGDGGVLAELTVVGAPGELKGFGEARARVGR
jgi:hypothetical protein